MEKIQSRQQWESLFLGGLLEPSDSGRICWVFYVLYLWLSLPRSNQTKINHTLDNCRYGNAEELKWMGEVENVSIILASSKDKVSFPSMHVWINHVESVVSLSPKYSKDIHFSWCDVDVVHKLQKKSSRNFCAWQIQGSGGIGAWLTTLLTWHPKKMPADQFAHIFISLTWAPLMHGFTFSTGFLRS